MPRKVGISKFTWHVVGTLLFCCFISICVKEGLWRFINPLEVPASKDDPMTKPILKDTDRPYILVPIRLQAKYCLLAGRERRHHTEPVLPMSFLGTRHRSVCILITMLRVTFPLPSLLFINDTEVPRGWLIFDTQSSLGFCHLCKSLTNVFPMSNTQ